MKYFIPTYILPMLVLLSGGLVFSQEAPTSIKAKIGRPVEVRITLPKETKLGWARGWNSDGCRFVRLHSDDPDEAVFEATPYEKGDYVVIFWKAGNIKHQRMEIQIEGNPVPPTPPIPPDPKPPTPPTPAPTEFVKQLKEAFDKDPLPTVSKRGLVISLAGFYAGVANSPWLKDEPIASLSDMLTYLRKTREDFCPEEALVGTRKVISEYMQKAIGGEPTAKVDDAIRNRCKGIFLTISNSLQEVK